jgi:hypothetical protein
LTNDIVGSEDRPAGANWSLSGELLMATKLKFILSAIGLIVLVFRATTVVSSDVAGQRVTPSSPPLNCEIRQRAWCIHNGSAEITELQPMAMSDPPGRAWMLRNTYNPASTLVILEPQGCREGLADTLSPVGLEHNVHWREKSWDQIGLRLRSDGSCDLKLLLPPFNGDADEWAFSQGRFLLQACRDEACTPAGPTPADVTQVYRESYMRKQGK